MRDDRYTIADKRIVVAVGQGLARAISCGDPQRMTLCAYNLIAFVVARTALVRLEGNCTIVLRCRDVRDVFP